RCGNLAVDRQNGLGVGDHQADDVKYHRCRCNASDFGVVVGRGHFDDVGADDVQPGHLAEHLQQLTRRQTTGFGGAGARGERRIEHIDVDGQVHRDVGDPTAHRVYRRIDADDVQVAGPDDLEPHPGVVVQVHLIVDGAADADVDRVVLDQQPFLERAAEDGAMGDRGVEVGVPGVQVRIEV